MSGTSGLFSIERLVLTIGAGFGLLSISVIIADFVMLHCAKNKSLYQKIKELDLKDEVENEVIQLDEVFEEDEDENISKDKSKLIK